MDFLKVWTHSYELVPKLFLNSLTSQSVRLGALLKIEFPHIGFGYADLHPWPEFGDHDLKFNLDSIVAHKPTALAGMALENAYTDAIARAQGKSLIQNTDKILNNALVTNVFQDNILEHFLHCESQGFDLCKIKIGRDLSYETNLLRSIFKNTKLQMRIDANSILSFKQAFDFLKHFTPEERSRIDYFEDPCVFSKSDWSELRTLCKIALDWESSTALSLGLPVCWDAIVIKPTRQDYKFWRDQAQKFNSKVTVTSSMDHPLGVMTALSKAQDIQEKFATLATTSGCQTVELYQSDDFSRQIKTDGPFLKYINTSDIGFGFTHLLESLPWK